MSFTYRPLDKLFPKRGKPFEFNPGKVPMPIEFSDVGPNILEAEVREDDVWLIGYPRAGQTWLQEIIWLIGNNLNFDLSKSVLQQIRAPRIEQSAYNNDIFGSYVGDISIEYIKTMRSPRYLRSNLPIDLLPKQLSTVKPKMIYSTRNPKDLWCAYYRFVKIAFEYDETPEESAKAFCNGKLPMGCMIDHMLPFWKMRNDSNILFLTHENMKRNTRKGIKVISDFLNKPLNRNQIDQIYEFVSDESLRNIPSINLYREKLKNEGCSYTFLEDNAVGLWRNQMPKDISKMFDNWIVNKTKGSGFKFKYT